MSDFLTISSTCILGLFCFGGEKPQEVVAPPLESAPTQIVPQNPVPEESAAQKTPTLRLPPSALMERRLTDPFDGQSVAGNYLASTFAQRRHNWGDSYKFLKSVMARSPDDLLLQKRAMILAMGAGDFKIATDMAARVNEAEENSTLAQLFLAIDAFERDDHARVAELVEAMQNGSISRFMLPLLESWSLAAQGQRPEKNLTRNTTHLYHAILIADFLGEQDRIESLLEKALDSPALRPRDIMRIADLYAHIGNAEKAISLYDKVMVLDKRQADILDAKIEALNAGEAATILETPARAAHGLAEALYDMARILYEDYNDDSARVFTNLALHLKPDLDNAKLLMGHITARNNQPQEAIAHYRSISQESDLYLRAHRRAADILEEAGQSEEALAELSRLVEKFEDVDSLIQMGDIHRRQNDYAAALARYNLAKEKLGGEIDEQFWHLHYVRGVAFERLGRWEEAENELELALSFRPNHPLVLNYLAYGWADQGINLKRALTMLRKAAALEPEDGYIADSLGWVLYQSGKHKEAIPYLEKAVELLPYDPVINNHLGDAYWRAKRKLEARFQWNRALENAQEDNEENIELRAQISQKLVSGLGDFEIIKRAHNEVQEETAP